MGGLCVPVFLSFEHPRLSPLIVFFIQRPSSPFDDRLIHPVPDFSTHRTMSRILHYQLSCSRILLHYYCPFSFKSASLAYRPASLPFQFRVLGLPTTTECLSSVVAWTMSLLSVPCLSSVVACLSSSVFPCLSNVLYPPSSPSIPEPALELLPRLLKRRERFASGTPRRRK